MGLWAKRVSAALAALTLTALPAIAQVPDPYAYELAQRLANAERLLTDNGYARAAGPFAGSLQQRGGRRFNLMLRAGQDYRIVGVCESHCADLDMRLYDPNNQLIAQDVAQDRVPVIHVTPTTTGNYTIEALMYRCNAAQCWYAFNVYSR